MLVFGHHKGVITLWETSKRYLSNEEIEAMQKKLLQAEYDKLDWEMMRKHNISPEKMVQQMTSIKRINAILDNAKRDKDISNHAIKIGKRRLKFRDSAEGVSQSHI